MSEDKELSIMQFAPLQSFVEGNFWFKLDEIKLEQDRLSEEPRKIYGFYTNRDTSGCLLQVDYTAFNNEFKPPKHSYIAHGKLFNKNTIEQFKSCDKQALLAEEGRLLIEDFKSNRILENPSLLARFFVLSFADIKCHTFYYWFAFPCPLTPTLEILQPGRSMQSAKELHHFIETLEQVSLDSRPFFALKTSQPGKVFYLKDILNPENLDAKDVFFCFADPNDFPQPSWLMRTYVAFICYKCPYLIGKPLNFLGVRFQMAYHYQNCYVWQVTQREPCDFEKDDDLKFVGWERNRNDRMGPRVVNMQDQMDPAVIAENSVNLNLKLMKWRLVPDLNLDEMAKTKCLLFGAGTLGCAVARNLLSWGFKHLSLIDNGRVGFSNPIRQNLYLYEDAKTGKSMKAPTAAKRLKEINPSATTQGHVMQIPMPGHTVGESLLEQTQKDLSLIDKLVQEHDAIFLLTDSRESRWLPTLLGGVYNKIVINAALGFDSYLVMRHGSSLKGGDVADAAHSQQIGDLKCINGGNLGCYFCNDVTAPGDSQKERTLDQQCTVTRPGVSNIAASYAVEILVSLLQHPLRTQAPAYYSNVGDKASVSRIPEGKLGIIPHSIRGNLYDFQNILPATQKFEQCIACSKKVLDEYRNQGQSFLLKVFETAKYLEDLTGISAYKELDSAVIDYNDSDLDMSDAED